MIRAYRTYESHDGVEEIEIVGGPKGTHRLQFGGQGDGYCFKHQSFDCLDTLTDEERTVLKEVNK